jgi:non-canonical (house-cleaning) NTP pyrophosphatase
MSLPDLSQFWSRFPTGVEVAVAGSQPAKLLGIRDGVRRYLYEGLDRPLPVAVVGQTVDGEPGGGLELSDEATVAQARRKAQQLERRLGSNYHFYAAAEGGLHAVDAAEGPHYFVRCWVVIVGVLGESWGASGSLEIPGRLLEGLDEGQLSFAVPGTRRGGGMIQSLSGGLESRRAAVTEATIHALSTLFYGVLDSRSIRGGGAAPGRSRG